MTAKFELEVRENKITSKVGWGKERQASQASGGKNIRRDRRCGKNDFIIHIMEIDTE